MVPSGQVDKQSNMDMHSSLGEADRALEALEAENTALRERLKRCQQRWCDENEKAAMLILGKQCPHHSTLEDLALQLQGSVIDDDGPFENWHGILCSKQYVAFLNMDHDTAVKALGEGVVKSNTAIQNVVRGLVSSWCQGMFTPVLIRSVVYHKDAPTSFVPCLHLLIVAQMPKDPQTVAHDVSDLGRERVRRLLTRDGVPRLMMIMKGEPQLDLLDTRVFTGCVRDHGALERTPAIVVQCLADGHVIAQNAWSVPVLGVIAQTMVLGRGADVPTNRQPLNYLLELLGSQASVDGALLAVSQQGLYRGRVHITSPTLLSYMQLPPDTQVHHHVRITKLLDGVSKETIYVVAQADVTETVLAERRVEELRRQQHELLKSMLPQQVIEVLLEKRIKTVPLALSKSNSKAKRLSKTEGAIVESGAVPGLLNRNITLPIGIADEGNPEFLIPAGQGSASNFPTRASVSERCSVSEVHDLSFSDVRNLSTYHDQVTILFAAVKDFGNTADDHQGALSMLFLNEVFSAFDALIDTHDVCKVETVGEVYMVCAGLFDRSSQPENKTKPDDATDAGSQASPKPNQDALGGHDPQHAHKMLGYAKAMLEAVAGIRTAQAQPVELLLGIHSGPIMTGVVGTRMPRFCCFGNTASRMQSTGTAGVIHASASFRDLTPDESWEPTGGVEVKGKGHMETYVLRCANDVTYTRDDM